jgi:hypothetical protein
VGFGWMMTSKLEDYWLLNECWKQDIENQVMFLSEKGKRKESVCPWQEFVSIYFW